MDSIAAGACCGFTPGPRQCKPPNQPSVTAVRLLVAIHGFCGAGGRRLGTADLVVLPGFLYSPPAQAQCLEGLGFGAKDRPWLIFLEANTEKSRCGFLLLGARMRHELHRTRNGHATHDGGRGELDIGSASKPFPW